MLQTWTRFSRGKTRFQKLFRIIVVLPQQMLPARAKGEIVFGTMFPRLRFKNVQLRLVFTSDKGTRKHKHKQRHKENKQTLSSVVLTGINAKKHKHKQYERVCFPCFYANTSSMGMSYCPVPKTMKIVCYDKAVENRRRLHCWFSLRI